MIWGCRAHREPVTAFAVGAYINLDARKAPATYPQIRQALHRRLLAEKRGCCRPSSTGSGGLPSAAAAWNWAVSSGTPSPPRGRPTARRSGAAATPASSHPVVSRLRKSRLRPGSGFGIAAPSRRKWYKPCVFGGRNPGDRHGAPLRVSSRRRPSPGPREIDRLRRFPTRPRQRAAARPGWPF